MASAVEFEPQPAMTGTGALPSPSGCASSSHVQVLVVAERRALAGGADRHQTDQALGDLPLDQPLVGLVIDLAA